MRERAGFVGDERHHVEHAQAWVCPVVGAQVEPGHAQRGERLGGLGDLVRRSGQGEDRPVVVRVAVQVEQDRRGGRGQLGEESLVAALAHVGHALEDHSASLPVARGGVGGSRRGGPGRGGRSGDGDGLRYAPAA